uniref:Zinc-ribbon domain-containing protein n=1 Tax=Opuntia streptacantha TaxID=393608 RepID=A0A7C9EUD1_OPUST
MGTRVPVQDFTSGQNDDDNNNLRSGDSYIHDRASDEGRIHGSQQIDGGREGDRISDIDSEAATESSLDRDEGSNTVDCLDEPYKDQIQIPTVLVEDDRSSLESSGSLRNPCSTLTAKDIMPVEAARSRFLQIIVDHFIGQHLIEKRGACLENTVEHGEDKLNKRKSGEVQYEGDPRFALPLMYVANLYETLVNEVNLRIASLNGLRDKTIGVALEASGGLYRKLTQKFPKTGPYSFKRRELATSLETRTRFPELVVQEEKRVRFVVANGLDIVEKPNGVPLDDGEWFKRLTGRNEVAVTSRDYKFYNPRHKIRRASLNTSPTIPGFPSYQGSSDCDFHSVIESPRQETPSKQPVVSMTRQLQFESAKLDQHESLEQNQRSTLLCHSHESDQAPHLPESNHAHSLHAFSQTMGSVHCLAASQAICPLNMMPSNPAKFCDECGSPYVRATSKFCSQCGTKRFGI